MRIVSFVPMFLLILILPSLPGRAGEQSPQLIFTNVTVIDTTGGPMKPGMTVVISGDRITDVAPAQTVQVPETAQVVDASGKFLIPGLWDMHAHLFAKDYLKLFVANGVTGVRIMWGNPSHFAWRKEIENSALPGPRLIIGSTIVDGPNPIWPSSLAVSNESEARQAVAKLKNEGYDFIKIYNLLPRAAFFGLADEAKKRGIPFAGHLPYSVSAAEASDAGIRSIEHLTGILAACGTREDNVRDGFGTAYSNRPDGKGVASAASTRPLTQLMLQSSSEAKESELLSHLKRNHTWQCPTLTVLRSIALLNDPDFRNDARLKYLPKQITTAWDPSADFRFQQKTTEDFDLSRAVYDKQLALVGAMYRAGVEILAGTDTPNPYCFPGFSLHDELGLLVKAGLSPLAALQSATWKAAAFLGLDRDLGSIEKNKMADLILLNANPLENIENTQRIQAVVARGKLIPRPALDEMLKEIEGGAATQSQINEPAPASAEDAATKEIRAWLERWTKALSAKDADAIVALYTDDVVAYDLVPPLQYVGKEAYRADYQQFFSQYESDLKVDIRDLHVGASGDLGYATGLESVSGTLKDGRKSEVWVRFTSLFRKSGDRWLDFHDHVSVPADFATGKAMLKLKP